jgi:hypothetical protein
MLMWKIKRIVEDIIEKFTHSKNRYTVKHKDVKGKIFVCVYDNKERLYYERRYSSYYGDDHPKWWTETMNRASYIYVNPPNDSEIKAGTTYEDKISKAYEIIQIIADCLNKAIQEQEERERRSTEASKIAEQNAKLAAKKYIPIKKL